MWCTASFCHQDTEYFSVARHERIREDFWSLCGGGWSVSLDALRTYGQDDGKAVGAVRASRSEGLVLYLVTDLST